MMEALNTAAIDVATTKRPRLGFLGVGWIGRSRMAAMIATGAIEAAAIADPSPEMAAQAQRLAPDAKLVASLDDLLDAAIDGVVIATPSAMHAAQAIRALERGVAVFCQKPLGRTEAEVRAVVEAARGADRMLGVDLSYRFSQGMARIRELVRGGELGRIFAADLVFHNAYGPDKPWFYDPGLSGGGCVMDLGVHLVDLALWTLGGRVERVTSSLFAAGEPLAGPSGRAPPPRCGPPAAWPRPPPPPPPPPTGSRTMASPCLNWTTARWCGSPARGDCRPVAMR